MNCAATYSTDTVVKFTDETAAAGLIQDDDEAADSSEVKELNNSRIKGGESGLQREGAECTAHTPLEINGTRVETVSSYKCLGVQISGGPDMDHPHYYSVKEDKAASVSS